MNNDKTFHSAEAVGEGLPKEVEEHESCSGFCEDCINNPFVLIDHEWAQGDFTKSQTPKHYESQF